MAKLQKVVALALLLNDKDELLISKRLDKNIPEADGKWEFVGGHVEFGESPEQAILREITEETGFTAEIEKFVPQILTNYWKNKDGEDVQVFLITYICRITGGQMHTEKFDHKISALKFIGPKEIEAYDTLPGVKELVNEYLLES